MGGNRPSVQEHREREPVQPVQPVQPISRYENRNVNDHSI